MTKVKVRKGTRGCQSGNVAALAREGQLGPWLPAAIIPVLSFSSGQFGDLLIYIFKGK